MICNLCKGAKKITGWGLIPGAVCYLCKGVGELPDIEQKETIFGKPFDADTAVDETQRVYKPLRNGRGRAKRE